MTPTESTNVVSTDRFGSAADGVASAFVPGATIATTIKDDWGGTKVVLTLNYPQGGNDEITISMPDPDEVAGSFYSAASIERSLGKLKTTAQWSSGYDEGPDSCALWSEALAIAAGFTQAMDEAYTSALDALRQEAQRQREAYLRERADDQIRTQKYNAGIKEALQWLVDQNGRLTRSGYRSTVQVRPLRRVDDHSCAITTERGDYMTIYYNELETFDIKYEGDRNFTQVEWAPRDEITVSEEEIDAYVKEHL